MRILIVLSYFAFHSCLALSDQSKKTDAPGAEANQNLPRLLLANPPKVEKRAFTNPISIRYIEPVLTFLPSIGIGPTAMYVSTGKNDDWDGNYFFAGMASQTWYRAK